MIALAKYKCMNKNCKYSYVNYPGPTICPKCGSEYIEWINYEIWRKMQDAKDKDNR